MSEVKKVKNESIKESSNGLRGTIAEELNDESLIKFSEDNLQVLKFHGIYQQDDRDKRLSLIKEKKENILIGLENKYLIPFLVFQKINSLMLLLHMNQYGQ